MQRTTIMLPSNLKNRAQAFASKLNISFGELVRESIEEKLHVSLKTTNTDIFFNDKNYFDGDTPADLSEKHDEYLHDYIY
jgi:hypothetical protein